MSRRKKIINYKREIGVDERFKSSLVQRFINVVMWRGKKNTARRIVYEAIEYLIKKSDGSAEKGLKLFQDSFNKIMPIVEVRPRRVGGSVYQIPMEVASNRANSLAMRWLLNAAASRKEKTMGLRIASELLEASKFRGDAVKKKENIQKMAEANRAFSHFAW